MTGHNNQQDNVMVSRELLRKIEDSLELRCGTNAPERTEILPEVRVALEQPVQEPEPIGEIVEDCNGYPWKRIEYRYPSDIADLPIGTKVFTAPRAHQT